LFERPNSADGAGSVITPKRERHRSLDPIVKDHVSLVHSPKDVRRKTKVMSDMEIFRQLSGDTLQQGLGPVIDIAAYCPRFAVYGATCAELVEVHRCDAPSVFVE
jgi:hypothetical protein